jgi:Recombination endonuclease VII
MPDKPGRGKYERTPEHREAQSKRLTRHGLSHTPTYQTWATVIQRCTNPKQRDYPWYGARGITVCDRWMNSFDDFLADMGVKPEGMILSRNDRKGNFEPGNCFWQPPRQADIERRLEGRRERYRRQKERDPEFSRWAHIKHRYGLDREAFEAIAAAQDGCCYLCGQSLDLTQRRSARDSHSFHVDHDHGCCPGSRSCGKCIRGLACEPCNRGLGAFGDDPERMRRAADRLEAAIRKLAIARGD